MKQQNMIQRMITVMMIVLLAIFQVITISPQEVTAKELTNGATITALDNNGEVLISTTAAEIEAGDTAFDILQDVTEAKGIEFSYNIHEQWGAEITSIAGTEPDNGNYWWYTVNGEDAPVGISSYEVENGDSLLFKVVSYPAETVQTRVTANDDTGEIIFDETVNVLTGSSAYDALKKAGKNADRPVTANIDDTYFASPKTVGPVELGEYDYWSFSINGESSSVGVSSYSVKNNDHINLTLTSWKTPSPIDEQTDPKQDEETELEDDDKPASPELNVNEAISDASQYMLKNGVSDGLGAVAIKASGQQVPASFLEELRQDIVTNNGEYRKITDYEKIVLGLAAVDEDATNFEGYNFIEKIYNNERLTFQGNNGVIFGLLAYDSRDYEIPEDATWTREKLINYLLDQQNESGGWPLFTGSVESVDITGMALTALAPYKEQQAVANAIDKAVKWISEVQDPTGGFTNEFNGGDSSESTAQVIIGLSSVGVDSTGAAFTKQSEGGTVNLLQHLLKFKQADGGFAHLLDDESSNGMASLQALAALTSYQYFNEGRGSIYRLVSTSEEPGQPEQPGQPEEPKPEDPKPENPSSTNPVQPKHEEPTKVTPVDGNHDTNVNEQPTNTSKNKPTTKLTDSPTLTVDKVVASDNGHVLPKTATSLYNWLLIGGLIAILGFAVQLYSRRNVKN
ncbi:DUF4430 domain-containing protein [Metabacillus malikii]|uniref:DUF4430 domain-containing protein n=1 Tax=Metabacillus malikii TaxID=1504265 RepID=A0ABT9ZCT4_9BACI|nr:DUF4430 domain-containing protein [Metabacillus malikii]MDQ0229626.1 hypothetical protein [Metabacillus malikii]